MKRKCLLLLMIVMLFGCAKAATIQERYEKIVEETERKEDRVMTREEKDWLLHLLNEANEDTLQKLRDAYVPKEKIYFNNTVCAFGPQFREVSSNLTRDWYMFTPVDLSKDGTQTYELIGGGMYVIGKLTVTVKNGTVTVDYDYASKDIEPGREYFTFFADYESITREDMDNFQKHYSYGKAYSIDEKLSGDTDVIIFVCNTATFEKTSRGVYRYYETNDDREALRAQMLEMIGK